MERKAAVAVGEGRPWQQKRGGGDREFSSGVGGNSGNSRLSGVEGGGRDVGGSCTSFLLLLFSSVVHLHFF